MRHPSPFVRVCLVSLSISLLAGCGGATSPRADEGSPAFESADPAFAACFTVIDGVPQPGKDFIKVRGREDGTTVKLSVSHNQIGLGDVPGFTVSADGRTLTGPLDEGELLCVPVLWNPFATGDIQTHVSLHEVRDGADVWVSTKKIDIRFRTAAAIAAMQTIAAAFNLNPFARPEFIGKDRFESSGLQEGRIPDPLVEIVATAVVSLDLVAAHITDLFGKPTFPEGPGDEGFTVLPDIPTAQPEGPWCFAAMMCDAHIPLADPEKHYQFGFVCDADGDPSNNYAAPPDYPLDTFRGTDLWFVLTYDPLVGWRLAVRDARGGGIVDVASAARVILRDNAIVLLVPKSEFGVADPEFRFTSFCHEGDFGQNPPFVWSADYHPEPADGAAGGGGGGGGGQGGSAEAQLFNGEWLLDGQAQDHCITIADGTITLWDEDCDTVLLGLAASAPGRTENGVVIWVVSPADGRVLELRQDTAPGSLTPTALTIFPAGGGLGAVSFPVLTPR